LTRGCPQGSKFGSRWTYSFIPDVTTRTITPLPFDHYISQILSGHGDFNSKLAGFNLTEDPSCKCGHYDETVEHMLEDCPLADNSREILRNEMESLGHNWPYENESYIKRKRAWDALGKFAKTVLTQKERTREDERRIQLH